MILGTAAYMSPEQARGRPVDKRTDVWAFGAVLYEMLAGARAFDGEDVSEVMASVVKSTPNWAALPADVPPHVVTLIQRCLQKDRNARIGDTAVARFLLSEHATLSTPSVGNYKDWGCVSVTMAPADVVGAANGCRLATLGAVLRRRVGELECSPVAQHQAIPVARLQMGVGPAERLPGSRTSASVSDPHIRRWRLSPDGRQVAFAGQEVDAVTQLYVRALERRGRKTAVRNRRCR